MLRRAAGETLLINLKSWRYILSVSLLGYLFTLALIFQRPFWPPVALSLGAGLATLFFCWRLWLDEQFFALFYRCGGDTDAFDAAVSLLWSKDLRARTLEQRWGGVSRLIKRAWLAVIIQWLCVLAALATALNQ